MTRQKPIPLPIPPLPRRVDRRSGMLHNRNDHDGVPFALRKVEEDAVRRWRLVLDVCLSNLFLLGTFKRIVVVHLEAWVSMIHLQ